VASRRYRAEKALSAISATNQIEWEDGIRMIQLPFDNDMILLANDRAVEMGALKNSITTGKANTAAFLGEIALAEAIGATVADTYNHDLIYEKDNKKTRIEVKTKRRIVDPLSHYEVSVAKTSRHQHPDLYAFVSITFDEVHGRGREKTYYCPKKIWLCGYYPGDRYWEDAKTMEAGQVDHSNGFKTHVPMYNLKISQLLL